MSFHAENETIVIVSHTDETLAIAISPDSFEQFMQHSELQAPPFAQCLRDPSTASLPN
jgi:hypothetical protein